MICLESGSNLCPEIYSVLLNLIWSQTHGRGIEVFFVEKVVSARGDVQMLPHCVPQQSRVEDLEAAGAFSR